MTIQKLEEAKHLQSQIEIYKEQLHLLHNSKISGLQLRQWDNDDNNYKNFLLKRDFPTGKIKMLLSELYREKITALSAKIEQM